MNVKRSGLILAPRCGHAAVKRDVRDKLPSITKGSGQVVAIVDAYDDPNIASDLAVYRSEFGLGTANFAKYNQTSQTSNYRRETKVGVMVRPSRSTWFRRPVRSAPST
jgi:hypothetical protein